MLGFPSPPPVPPWNEKEALAFLVHQNKPVVVLLPQTVPASLCPYIVNVLEASLPSVVAERLNVSPKYLSATVKRVTGHSVSSYIDRHTVPIIKDYLNDERLSLTQIAEHMNFASLSYFSRYCTKHLGQSPSEYRRSLQPK